jgi:hypothetical protein
MYVRRAKSHGKLYTQIVESFRRKSDGMVCKRVVAGLGCLSDLEHNNFVAAFKAARNKERVVVASAQRPSQGPAANLQHLDLAVLLELWHRRGVDEVLTWVLPSSTLEVSPAQVVAALAIQRCVAPGSKLSATRWFPRTALPELLGVLLSSFNNSRIHRTLEQLASRQQALQTELAQLYRQQDGAFATLFFGRYRH